MEDLRFSLLQFSFLRIDVTLESVDILVVGLEGGFLASKLLILFVDDFLVVGNVLLGCSLMALDILCLGAVCSQLGLLTLHFTLEKVHGCYVSVPDV